jgi:hypothetical protein
VALVALCALDSCTPTPAQPPTSGQLIAYAYAPSTKDVTVFESQDRECQLRANDIVEIYAECMQQYGNIAQLSVKGYPPAEPAELSFTGFLAATYPPEVPIPTSSQPVKTSLEPFFPWPPPEPFASEIITQAAFSKGDHLTLGQAAERIERQLHDAGYAQGHFFSAADGFALVAPMERVSETGVPLESPRRWEDIDHTTFALKDFSLDEFLESLLKERSGYFRIFVFIVTSSDLVFDPKVQVTPEVAREWQERGRLMLPNAIASRSFSSRCRLYVLLYQFRKQENHSPEVIAGGLIEDQLRATGLRLQ